jgi:branched-chain amino acid transport system permease protein
MIIIGGQGSILGSLLGAIFVTALPFAVAEWFHHMKNGFLGISSSELFDVQALIYGLSIIGFLLFEPDGLAAIVQRARKWLSTWPLSQELNDANW